MHVVLIGWLYVVAMIAVVSDSWLKGIIRFLFLGALPVGLWLWLTIRRRRRELDAQAQAAATSDDASA